MKKRMFFAFITIFLIISVLFFLKISKDYVPTVYTTLSINTVSEKVHTDDYYLIVVLDDYIVEEYNLSYNRLTLRATESLYNKINVGSDYIGISVVISPYESDDADIGYILKSENTKKFLVIAATKGNNIRIE